MTDETDPILTVVEEFLERSRRGERPTINEYCDRHPELAEEIRDVFPTLAVMEGVQHNLARTDDFAGEQPQRIGEYQIVREIGRGGMGIVYEAQQESLNRPVALKVLTNGIGLTPQSRVRFRREARAAAQMHHTNIVPVFEVGEEGNYLFYAMQLIHGESLDQCVFPTEDGSAGIPSTKVTTSPVDRSVTGNRTASESSPHEKTDIRESTATLDYLSVARIGRQAAEGLAYAHERGVIHRDVKPSNLLLDEGGIVWITDFGLAKTNADVTITQAGDFLGTLRYMAPERFRDQCDARADVYGLGATLYEILVQRPMHSASDRLRLITEIRNETPIAPTAIDPGIPRDLETIILKAIDKDVSARYQTASALAEDLDRFLNDQPILARRVSLVERFTRWARKNRGLAAAFVGIAGLLLILGFGGTVAAIMQSNLREDAIFNQRIADTRRAEADLARRLAEDEKVKAQAAEQATEARRAASQRSLYFLELKLAGRLLESPGGPHRVQEILERWEHHPEVNELRGWEWNYLTNARALDGISLPGVSNARAAAWRSDGRLVAIPVGNEIRFFNAQTGEKFGERLVAHRSDVLDVAWNPDGSSIASTSEDGRVRIWKIQSNETGPKLFREFGPFPAGISRIAWSSSGSRIVFAVDDVGIYVLNLDDEMAQPEQLEGVARNFVRYLELSPDGRYLAMGVWFNNWLFIHDLENRETVANYPDGAGNPQATMVMWDGDHAVRHLLHSSSSGRIDLYDPASKKRLRSLVGHTMWSSKLDVSPDQTLLLSGSNDTTLRVWDVESGTTLRLFGQHRQKIRHASFSPDGSHVLSADRNRVFIWPTFPETHRIIDNRDEGEPARDAREFRVTGLAWSPDGERLAVSSFDHASRVYDVANETILSRKITDPGYSVAWQPNDDKVLFGINRSILLTDLTNNTTKELSLRADDVAWNRDGNLIASRRFFNSEHTLSIHRFPELSERLTVAARAEAIAFHPTQNLVAFVDDEGVVIINEFGDELHRLHYTHFEVYSIHWHPNAQRLAFGGEDRKVHIWDLSTGETTVLTQHSNHVHGVHWNNDGSRLATGSLDGTVRIFETERWSETFLFRRTSAVTAVAWSPNGKQLAAGDDAGQIIIWTADEGPAKDQSDPIEPVEVTE